MQGGDTRRPPPACGARAAAWGLSIHSAQWLALGKAGKEQLANSAAALPSEERPPNAGITSSLRCWLAVGEFTLLLAGKGGCSDYK
jgi:hypothetical protein